MKIYLERLILNEWESKKEIQARVFFEKFNKIENIPINPFMENASTKKMLGGLLKTLIREFHPSTITFLSESWMASFEGSDAKTKTEEALKKYGKVSKMPEKIESVMLLMWSPRSTIFKMWAIDRTKKQPLLVPWEDFEVPITQEDEMNPIFKNPFS